MNITHNNEEYILDIEKAIKKGVLVPKPKYVPRPGDVFTWGPAAKVVLIQDYHTKLFTFIGVDEAFKPYSNGSLRADDVLGQLNKWNYKYLGNMSERFEKTLNEFVQENS